MQPRYTACEIIGLQTGASRVRMARPVMIGTIIDKRYKVLQRLGEGAMGEVYLVENVELLRKEALKILRGSLAAYPDLVARFRREARAINRLSHPNIVTLYELGALEDGRLYMAMEHAEGQALAHLLRTAGSLSTPRTLRILVQLAEAIEHAHGRGVVHRDLKPENLVIVGGAGRNETLKVLDFGIAKIAAEDVETTPLSRVGRMMGTAPYMSPELLRGDTADPRSDLYAVGCIGYELLAGDPPFRGNIHQVLQAHLNEAPQPLRVRRPDAWIPPELEAVVMRCLEKDPRRRFQSARDLLYELRRTPGFVESSGAASPSAKTPVPPAPGTSPFDLEDSTQQISARRQAALAFELQPTGPIAAPPRDYESMVRTALREITEALIDFGYSDAVVLSCISQLRSIDQDVAEINGETMALESELAALDENVRRRVGLMRFALGELRIDRALLKGEAAQDADLKIEALQRRLDTLRAYRDREVGGLGDRGVQLAAGRATLDEKAASTYATLSRYIDDRWPELIGIPPVVPLLDLLQRARAEMAQAERDEE